MVWSLALAACSMGAQAADVLAHGRFSQVRMYRPAGEVKQFVLFLSGETRPAADLAAAAQALAHEGAMVALIDTHELLASLEHDGAACTFPDGDLENLSRYLQAYYRLPSYMTPILIGYGEGGTLAYAMLAQAPADLFAGAVSVQFCRTLPLQRPLCAGTQLAATARANGMELLPAAALQVPWVAVQLTGESECPTPLTPEFIAAVPHAQVLSAPAAAAALSTSGSGLSALLSAYQKVAAQRLPEAPPPASLADLPIIEMPATATGDLFAVFLSGDGGWAGIDRNVAAALVARGISVAGVDSLRYFWSARTPQGLAADLDRIMRYYAFHWQKKHVLLIGYSQGADVLPFAINRLPQATLRRVVLAALLALDERADFEFHLASWVVNGDSGLAVRPEIDKLAIPAALCIFGDDDSESLCPQLRSRRVKLVKLAGGHHFNGDYDAVAQTVVRSAAQQARAH